MSLKIKSVNFLGKYWPWAVGLGAGIFFARWGYMESQKTNIIPKEGTLDGIDVSHYQGDIDWAQVKAAGVKFAFIKAAQGASNTDDYFNDNYVGAISNGIRAYPYFFYNPGDDPAAQADNFLNAISGHGPNMVAIDLEENKLNWQLAPADPAGTRFQIFLQKLAAANLQITLYVNPTFLSKWFPQAAYLAQFPKWVAKWSSNPPDSWSFWQYTAYGQVPGISGNVDLDYFRGTVLP